MARHGARYKMTNHTKIRKLLRSHPDGMTTLEVTTHTGVERSIVQQAMKDMPDVYIDRWVTTLTGPPQAVWIGVVPPDDCPKPPPKPRK